MTEETKVVLGIAGAFLLGLLFVSAASVGKERAHYDYERGYAAAVDSVRGASGEFVQYDTLHVPLRVRFADEVQCVDVYPHLWVHRDGTVEVVR